MSGKIYNLQIPNTLRKKIITTSLTRQKSRKNIVLWKKQVEDTLLEDKRLGPRTTIALL